MDQIKQEGLQINIFELLGVLLKRWWLIFLAALLGASASLAYTIAFVKPKYQSSVLFYVNNTAEALVGTSMRVSSGDISTAKTLIGTYSVIIKTRMTLEDVSAALQETGLDYSYGALNGMISMSSVNDTEVFRVTVTCGDPSDACTIANTIAKVLPKKIVNIIEGSSVRVVDYAIVASERTSPSYTNKTLTGFVIGAAAAVALLVVLYLLNDTITNEQWLMDNYKDEIPLLATIPDAEGSGRSGYSGYRYGGYRYGRYRYGKYRYGYGKGYGYRRGYGYGRSYGYGYGKNRGYYGTGRTASTPTPAGSFEKPKDNSNVNPEEL